MMSKWQFTKLIILPGLLGVAVGVFFFTEVTFSLPVISWHHRFERALRDNGEVRLGDLVNFKWERIYLLETYTYLTEEEMAQLFPSSGLFGDLWWWEMSKRYWTIAYQRPG